MLRQGTRKSDAVIKIARIMDNAMNLNGLSTNDVEDKLWFNYQDSIAMLAKFLMARYTTELWIMFQKSNALLDLVDKFEGTTRTILGNKVENR